LAASSKDELISKNDLSILNAIISLVCQTVFCLLNSTILPCPKGRGIVLDLRCVTIRRGCR
jgi:hypothetical protein